jgi:predicted amidohydrolase
MKIALCDKESIFNDINKNFNTMMECLDEAFHRDTDIIVFSESFLTGYSSNPKNICTISENSDIIKKIIKKCKESKTSIIFGFNEKDKKHKYISTLIYDNSKNKIYKYRKTHLGLKEAFIFKEGDKIGNAKINNTKIGINLCLELHIPELFLHQAIEGAYLIFILSASPGACGKRRDIWHKILPARGNDNTMIIIALNSYGYTENNAKLEGGTAIVNSKGEFIYENYQGNKIHFIEINFDHLIKRKNSKKLNYPLKRRKELLKKK